MLTIIIVSVAVLALIIWAATDLIKYRTKARRCRKAREQKHAAMPVWMKALSNNLPDLHAEVYEYEYLKFKWNVILKYVFMVVAISIIIALFISR